MAGSVFGDPIISAVLFNQTWLAKCMFKNWAGRPVSSMNILGTNVDELLVKMASLGANLAIFFRRSPF